MNSQTLLNKPQTSPVVVARISKIGNLAETSDKVRKSSTSLRKVFEKGTYQKRTQLSILKRYKKRLDTIQKQNDKNFLRKKQVKIKLPEIKKYAGNFFTKGSTSDPLKAIGALAAFNTAQKVANKDYLGAIGPALVAAGIFLGPGLLKGGISVMQRGGGSPGTGISGSSNTSPWWSKNPKSLSRANQSYARFISGESNIGDRARLIRRGMISPTGAFTRGGPEQIAKYGDASRVGKAFGRFGKSIVPVAGAALGAIDATMRSQEGDITGASIAGTSASLDALAAASAATGIGLPVAGLLSIASFGLDVINLVRDLSGASEKESLKNKPQRLQQLTQEQKKLVEQKKKEEQGGLTFGKTLNRYEKVVDKFLEFAKAFKGGMGMQGEQFGTIETGNRAIPTGQTLQDVEATGGEVPGTPNSPYGQQRGSHIHKGNDYFRSAGTPISVIQPGTVTVADMNYDPTGWGAVVEIRHQDGSISRYAHLSKIYVAAGTQISPGQVIGLSGGIAGAPGSGNSEGPHLHFEYENSSGRIDPTNYAPKIFRFGGNVKVKQKSQQERQLNQLPLQSKLDSATPTTGVNLKQLMKQFTFGMPPKPADVPSISPSPSLQRLSLQAPDIQPITIPVPIQQPQQQVVSSGGGGGMMIMPGPSQQQLLNSFYRRVLLNTV